MLTYSFNKHVMHFQWRGGGEPWEFKDVKETAPALKELGLARESESVHSGCEISLH